MRAVSRPGLAVAGTLALLGGAFLLVGLLLPKSVEVTRRVRIDAPPAAVHPYLDDLRKWDEWAPWGDVASRIEGRASGEGARRAWDDPSFGTGSLTLVESRPPDRVSYVVDVEDGAIRFFGAISIAPGDSGSTVTWTERAELGRNPILGWTALALDEAQGRQLAASLDRLKRRLEDER